MYNLIKFIIIIGLLLLIPLNSNAVTIDLDTIARIESTYNAEEYNEGSGATGLYQITEICLEDYNNYHEITYTLKDLYNKEINEKIAKWYIQKRIPQMLKSFNKPITERNILISYNAGIEYVTKDLKLSEETKDYLIKYKQYKKDKIK